MSDRKWTPVRRGSIYCSPACGYGCKHAAFLKAERDAKKLAAQLGPEWKPHVWENLGWHYRVTLNGIDIDVSPPGVGDLYSACLGHHYIGRGRTASAAIREMVETAQDNLKRFGASMDPSLLDKLGVGKRKKRGAAA